MFILLLTQVCAMAELSSCLQDHLASVLLYALSLDILPCENGLQLDSIIQRNNAFLTPFQRKVLYLHYIFSLDYFLYFLNFVFDINFHILVTIFKTMFQACNKGKFIWLIELE